MSETGADRSLDTKYVPFPSFEQWQAVVVVDTARWDRSSAHLKSREADFSSQLLESALNVAKRAAALDTGAIEGLYATDRGFTYSVAVETAVWETQFAENTEYVRSLFEAQLAAYDYVLTLATGNQPISEAAIRALHEKVCAAQTTYKVMTPAGWQDQALPKGAYKTNPNNVDTVSGGHHIYASVTDTPPEMARLVIELTSTAFKNAHPASQAAYAHYCLVAIHPFADGNGRVARALASCFTYKAIRMPIVIFTEHKKPYWTVLEGADAGNYQIFMDFMVARSLETIELVSESLRSASQPEIKDSIAAIHHLYITRGGYTYEQIDYAGTNLLKALQAAVSQACSKLSTPKITVSCGLQYGVQYDVPAGYRVSARISGNSLGGQMMTFVLQSSYPASAKVASNYCLALPKNAAGDDDIQLIAPQLPVADIFAARIDQVIPEISATLQIRLNMFAERIVKESFARLRTEAEKASDLNRR